ncbi:MAG: SDR family NAD(P)-dependent oxidoreductase [Bacteroidales bacterium]|jgi:short-subunit dehydrogenase|nr:SDR family NAD(P)-dependent oxidoreductase [Bacteroidales bacterium]MBR6279620.1 SDR family NAD(P)-dependent oxidoreductase [Bacteroidales bacterium]
MKIVITGASSGLGFQSAKLFIQAGWQTVVLARRTEKLEELKAINPNNVTACYFDINDDKSPEKLKEILSSGGKTDIYFHVSGIGCHNRELDLDKEMNVLETNCKGFAKCIDTAFNYFKENGGGQIAAISSIAGTKGLGAAPSYSASKAMNNTYLQCLRQLSKMVKADIKITDIRPGFVKTALLDSKRNYPMLMTPEYAAKKIFKAILRKKRTAIIDWKYAILVFFWKLIPDCIWERLNIDTK